MMTPEEAWRTIAAELVGDARAATARAATSVPRADSLGRVLAAPIAATVDQPPADVSAMDGYALGEGAAAGAPLAVVGTAAAGDPPAFAVPAGAAARIMTGAPLPAGADRVVPIEETDGGTTGVVVHRLPPPGAHVRRRGEVTRAGEPLLPVGRLLDPPSIALLASHGVASVEVVAPPRLALLATGDEVVPPDADPGPGRLRDSNTPLLAAATAALGVVAEPLGISPDRPEALRALLAAGLERDVLLVTGGVSMGAFDFVEETLAGLGCRVLVDGVAMQPGKPLLVARSAAGRWIFGLPGNPASVLVTFRLFVHPLLSRLLGRSAGFFDAFAGVLAGPLPAGGDRDRFLPATLALAGGRLEVTPRSPRGSHDLVAWAGAGGLVRVRPGSPAAVPGDRCEALPFRAGSLENATEEEQ